MIWRSLIFLALLGFFPGSLSMVFAAGIDDKESARLYHDYCSVCHGDKGDGKSRATASLVPPPKDFTLPQVAVEMTRERMIHSIREGRPGTAMVAWRHQLSDSQIVSLAEYIRNRFMVPTAYDTTNEGRRVYAEYCSVCHGDKGNGVSRASGSMRPSPRDFTSKSARRELTRNRMIFSITYGRADTAMPGWKSQLNQNQIREVVDYIRTGFMSIGPGEMPEKGTSMAMKGRKNGLAADGHQHEHTAPENNMAAYFVMPFPKKLVGHFKSGKKMYLANCVPCHGELGNGRGPRAYFILPRPRDFSHPAAQAGLNRPHLFEAISKGTLKSEMPAWEKVLTDQQIADISEYVLKQFIRPPRAKTGKSVN